MVGGFERPTITIVQALVHGTSHLGFSFYGPQNRYTYNPTLTSPNFLPMANKWLLLLSTLDFYNKERGNDKWALCHGLSFTHKPR